MCIYHTARQIFNLHLRLGFFLAVHIKALSKLQKGKILTHVAIEKNENATVARAASMGIPLVSWVWLHWLANRQKHTNHRKAHAPRKHTGTRMHKHHMKTSTSDVKLPQINMLTDEKQRGKWIGSCRTDTFFPLNYITWSWQWVINVCLDMLFYQLSLGLHAHLLVKSLHTCTYNALNWLSANVCAF